MLSYAGFRLNIICMPSYISVIVSSCCMSIHIEMDGIARSVILLTWGLFTLVIMAAQSGCTTAAFSLQLTPAQNVGMQSVRGCRDFQREGRG